MISLKYVKTFLRVDDDADDDVITALIDTSVSYCRGAIGENVDFDEPRVELLQCMYIADMYDNRTAYSKKGSYSLAVSAMLTQLRLEYEGEFL